MLETCSKCPDPHFLISLFCLFYFSLSNDQFIGCCSFVPEKKVSVERRKEWESWTYQLRSLIQGSPFFLHPNICLSHSRAKADPSKPAITQESVWGAALNLLLGHQIKLILKLKLWCRRRLPGSTRQGPICPSSQFEIPMGGNGFLRQSLWNDTSKTKMTNPFWVALGGKIKTLAKCPFSAEGQSWELLAALCMQAEPSVSWNCFGTARTDEKWRQTWAQSMSWRTELKVGWRRNFRSKAVSGFLC